MPVLVGSNRDEATSLMGRMLPSNKSGVEFLVKSQFPDVADAFFEAYPVATDADARRAFIDAFSDRVFAWHMKTWAALSETVSSPAWLYFFTHAPPHPEKDFYGAYHAAEIAYAFDNLDKLDYEYADEDRELAEAMSGYWVAFASRPATRTRRAARTFRRGRSSSRTRPGTSSWDRRSRPAAISTATAWHYGIVSSRRPSHESTRASAAEVQKPALLAPDAGGDAGAPSFCRAGSLSS